VKEPKVEKEKKQTANAFLIFRKSIMNEVMQKFANVQGREKMKQVCVEAGERWKQLEPAEKEKWRQRALNGGNQTT
jgi:hypothetical protein